MQKDVKKLLKLGLISFLLLFIVTYAFFRTKDLIYGVKIENMNINDGMTVNENILAIAGKARNAVNLSLNGRIISVDQTGKFNETIALYSGYNIISIKASDKFGNNDEKDYKLMHFNSD